MPVGSLYVYPTSVQINMYEDTITLAGQAGDAEIFKTLIYSVNTNVHTLNVKKAMLYACEYNHLDIVKFLVSMNFTLNQNLVMKKTPLYVACEKGHIELATYLIQRFEIDPNIQCEDSNKTALFVSAEKGFKDIVTELIRRPDIDVNKTTSGKKTALYVAIEKNQVECVRQILKKCRADDLYATTSFGTTPLFAAQKKGCKEIIRLMMCVGRTSNPDYEKTVPQVAEENKENIIISELPRFLQEVRAFYELFPSEFNGGLKPNNKNKVQSRYMEGVSNPKRANEEDEVHIHPQNTLRKTRSQSQAAFQIKQRPQTAKVTLKQPRLKESQVQSDNDSDSQDEYIQEDEYEDEEFKEGIKKCGQETTIKKKQSIKPQITKIRENSTLMKPLKKDIISNENKLIKAVTIVNQIGKIPKYLEKLKKTKTQEEKLEVVKEPTDSEYENPIMSKVKSRLFDYLQTNKQQQQDEEEKKAQEKLIVQKPVNIKRLGELSKPRRPLDIKECFVPQKNQKLIVYRDPNYLPPSILEKYDVSVDGVLMSQSLKEQKGELNIVNEKQKQSPHKDKRLKSGVRRNTTSTNFLNLQTKLFSINSKRSKKKQVQQNKSINQQNNSLNRLQNNRDIEGMIENKQPNQDLNFYQDLNDREQVNCHVLEESMYSQTSMTPQKQQNQSNTYNKNKFSQNIDHSYSTSPSQLNKLENESLKTIELSNSIVQQQNLVASSKEGLQKFLIQSKNSFQLNNLNFINQSSSLNVKSFDQEQIRQSLHFKKQQVIDCESQSNHNTSLEFEEIKNSQIQGTQAFKQDQEIKKDDKIHKDKVQPQDEDEDFAFFFFQNLIQLLNITLLQLNLQNKSILQQQIN